MRVSGSAPANESDWGCISWLFVSLGVDPSLRVSSLRPTRERIGLIVDGSNAAVAVKTIVATEAARVQTNMDGTITFLARVNSFEGVKSADVYILTKWQYYDDWIMKEINKRLLPSPVLYRSG